MGQAQISMLVSMVRQTLPPRMECGSPVSVRLSICLSVCLSVCERAPPREPPETRIRTLGALLSSYSLLPTTSITKMAFLPLTSLKTKGSWLHSKKGCVTSRRFYQTKRLKVRGLLLKPWPTGGATVYLRYSPCDTINRA